MGQTTRFQKGCWAVFDFANSSFPTIITTFIFAAYFSQGIVGDEVRGTSLWGYATSAAGLVVALLAPICGAIADQRGGRKPWIAAFSLCCIVASSLLWFATPEPSSITFALVCVVVATVGFEMAMVFYNAMLPSMATAGAEGRLSGIAWGIGYFGSLVSLTIALLLFIQTDQPLFGLLDPEQAEHLRISGPYAGLWYGVFLIPFLIWVPDQPRKMPLGVALGGGLSVLWQTLKNWRQRKTVFACLGTRMIYTDGLNTLFAFGGIYAAGTFQMPFEELVLFAIALNVMAGIGAFVFGWLDDRWGPKRVIMLSLVAMTFFGCVVMLVPGKEQFVVVTLILSLFFGPTQAASRTYMAYVAPVSIRTEAFGLYALSGKVTSFVGPFLVALATDFFDSQRIGLATILPFFILGLVLMARMPDIRRVPL